MPKHHNNFSEIIMKVPYEWKIKYFDIIVCDNGMLKSPKFLISDANFSIQLYLDGSSEDYVGWVSIFLYKEISQTDHRIDYTLGLRLENGVVLASRHFNYLFPSETQRYGYSKFIKRSKLFSVIQDRIWLFDTLTVFCEVHDVDVSVMEDCDSTEKDEIKTSLSDTFETLSEDFEKFYVSGWKTDVVMDVGGEKFSAHSLILSARSSVFRSMFDLDMKEKGTGSININDCDPESFGAFLLFLYSGKLNIVSSDNALNLYTTADKYNVQDLKKKCSEYLAGDLSIDSICDVLRLAALYEERELLKSATIYFYKNVSKILTTLKWQTLLRENPTLANELFIGTVNKMADS